MAASPNLGRRRVGYQPGHFLFILVTRILRQVGLCQSQNLEQYCTLSVLAAYSISGRRSVRCRSHDHRRSKWEELTTSAPYVQQSAFHIAKDSDYKGQHARFSIEVPGRVGFQYERYQPPWSASWIIVVDRVTLAPLKTAASSHSTFLFSVFTSRNPRSSVAQKRTVADPPVVV